MGWLGRLWRRVRFLGRWRRFDAELDEEIGLHVDLRTEALVRAGWAPAAARDEALRVFGNGLRLREQGRSAWGWDWLQTVVIDARHAWRLLLRDKLVTCTLAGVLALGIGSTALVFSLLDALQWSALPYHDRTRLVILETARGADRRLERASLAELLEWQQQTRAVVRLSGWRTRALSVGDREAPERLVGQLVSCDFFRTLGVGLAQGAGFTAADCNPGAERVAIVSDSVWRNRLGSLPAAVGQHLILDNERVRIVGVLPARFRGFLDGSPARIWEPLRDDPGVSRNEHVLGVVGRPADRVSLSQAREALKLAGRDASSSADGSTYSVVVHDFDTLASVGLGPPARLVMTAALLVLFVACANVAIMLLARGLHRRHELTMRRVLGAGRWRLARQLLVEALVLGLLAGAGGIGVAVAATSALSAVWRDLLAPLGIERVGIDPRALAFVLLVSVATGLASGLLPALRASDVALSGGERPGRRANRVGRAKSLLIVTQSALSLVLLCAALMLLRSFTGIADSARNPGFRTADVWSFTMAVPERERDSDEARKRFFGAVLERIQAVPGVASCALVSRVPYAQRVPLVEYATGATESVPAATGRAGYRLVTPGYFQTLGMRVVHGRSFTERGGGTPAEEAMLTETLAARLGDRRSILGRSLRVAGTWRTVVGVVADTRATMPGERPPAEVLVPYLGQYPDAVGVLVHRPGSTPAFAAELGTATSGLLPGPHALDIRPLSGVLRESIRGVAFVVALAVAFAAVALLVTLIGVAGVVAHSVARRTREVGVRLALGATRRDVLALMVRQSAIRIALGTAFGVLLTLAATRVLPSRLFGARPGSPLLLLGVAIAFTAAGVCAALLAARRAAGVDPTVALRQD